VQIELGSGEAGDIDAAVNERVLALARALGDSGLVGVLDVVPAFSSLAVYFDPLRTNRDQLTALVGELAGRRAPALPREAPIVRVPVCYGGDCGPDLESVAHATRLDPGRVIELHCAPVYRVFMIGFSPGFPYLGVVDERLRVARRAVPRTSVAAGSVGLAGPQTGIYPSESPGGWQIIGRTPLRLFDPSRDQPCLLGAGSHVRFEPVTVAEYAALASPAPGVLR
jgi:inhibitor of KinA